MTVVGSTLPVALNHPRGRRPLLALQAEAAVDILLREGLEKAKATKASLERGLNRVARALPESLAAPTASSAVKDPKSKTTFDAVTGVTKIVAEAKMQRSIEALALLLDPRAWSASSSVIAAAFLVEEMDNGEYTPCLLERVGLGQSWTRRGRSGSATQNPDRFLLYEYARSEIASFENILRIKEFTATHRRVYTSYDLHECLVSMFGAFSAPGGLTMNAGFAEATPCDDDPGWCTVKVVKSIRVRDLTPNDPGNPYDYGRLVNATMGPALSAWVHDVSRVSPVP
jgi:hypothetical protein